MSCDVVRDKNERIMTMIHKMNEWVNKFSEENEEF